MISVLAFEKPAGEVIVINAVPTLSGTNEEVRKFGLSSPLNVTLFRLNMPTGGVPLCTVSTNVPVGVTDPSKVVTLGTNSCTW